MLSELDALVSKLYEDWVAGRINETNFIRMMEKAQGEQEALRHLRNGCSASVPFIVHGDKIRLFPDPDHGKI